MKHVVCPVCGNICIKYGKTVFASEILKIMPTDKSIEDIYKRMTARGKLEKTIFDWCDAVVWEEFHRSTKFSELWN